MDRGVQCVCVLEIDKPAGRERPRFEGITRYLASRSRLLEPEPEVTPGASHYAMFNTGGVEVEVGEFLYAFVKMIKPRRILETGTHLGISAMYMAQALKENGAGTLTTLEIFPHHIARARRLWGQTGTDGVIEARHQRSLDYEPEGELDMLFLDSEPGLRFDELVRFYGRLRPGGFILIHDLHHHLGRSNLVVDGLRHWPFGDYREKFGHLIADFSLQVVAFRTPRGFVLLQKADAAFAHTRQLRGLD
jgi:predicted O-methyltransferase YrrM